jgi:7-cyano-7-deazaguanine synthase
MLAEKPVAVVLLSGGMDSCVTAAVAAENHRLALLHSSYGQLTEAREKRAFEEIAAYFHAPFRLMIEQRYLGRIGGSALTDPFIPVPQPPAAGGAPGEIPATYVPFRNAHFLAAAVSWAEALGAHRVYIGAVEQDSSGYPDCRPAYYRAFNDVVRLGVRPTARIEICAPLIEMSKAEIIRRGIALGAPLHLTWSCYQSSDVACGVCDSCLLRLRAFAQAGAADPIPYRTA